VTTEHTGDVHKDLMTFLEQETGVAVPADQDLFSSGLVSSMFAMKLVVHLEQAYGVSIVGKDLRLDNFRTVVAMAALVARLQGAAANA
jgi:methoxymalonate biosynthesis acyl carrier protein